jgi:ribose transport system substrate-binding protein
MSMEKVKTRRTVLVALVAAAVVALAGCGSSSSSSSSSSAAAPASSSTTAAASSSASTSGTGGTPSATTVVVKGVPPLSQLTGQGYEAPPPTTGPPAAKGKTVWWISCGQSIPPCAAPAAGAMAAAKALGITFHIADGKLNVGGGNATAIRTAIAAKPDAIILHGISCPAVEQPLREAMAAHIPVMGVEALDCSDTGGPKLFTANMQYDPKAPTAEDYFTAWGKVSADALIDLTGGKAKVLDLHGPEPLFVAINNGFTTELKKCSGCQIIGGFAFTSADEVPNGPMVQMLRPLVLKESSATAVMLPVSPAVTLGAPIVAAALPKAVSVGGSGEIPELDLIRQGKFTAATGAHDSTWMGWAAMDEINRVLNNKPTVPEGVGFRVITKTANLPSTPGSPYVSPIPYKADYMKLWSSSK